MSGLLVKHFFEHVIPTLFFKMAHAPHNEKQAHVCPESLITFTHI